MSRLLRLTLVLWLALAAWGANACTTGGCVAAGPRLASVDSTRGALLNALMGRLTNSTVTATVGDWNTVATGSVSLAKTLSALQTTLNVSTPTTALNTGTSLFNIVSAAATAATNDQKLSLATSLNAIAGALNGPSGTIRLGDLLTTDGGLGNTTINALELVSGAVQLYNAKNVLTTPSAIALTGLDLGLASLINNVSLAAQVVEPPVYVCGPTGSTFHTATIRVKLNIDLVSVNLNTGLLAAIPLVNTVSLSVTHLDLYLEVARANGTLGTVDAIANALNVQATPGVVDIYLGIIPDSTFFNRSTTLQASDVGPGTIASLTINGSTVAVKAKGSARGQAPSATLLSFNGPYPQTRTAYTQAGFTTNLLSSLVANLTLSLTPSLPLGLDSAVLGVLKTIFGTQLVPVLSSVVSALVDPLLEILGVRLGEVDVTAGGTMNLCTLSGCVYEDSNHSAVQDSGETGTALPLYAKLVDPAKPAGPAVAAVTVTGASCQFSFTGVQTGNWTVVVNSTPGTVDVTPAVPAGWVATQNPALTLPVVLSGDSSGTRFGLYHGSTATGKVFNDNGAGGGTPNNGTRDGAEVAVSGSPVKALDGTTSAVLDTAVSGDAGRYTLWIPYTAATVKIVQASPAGWVSVGGSAGTSGGTYTLATDTIAFTHASGSQLTGLDFADVPASRFETDGQQWVAPGGVVFHPHSFTAGTAGTLVLSTSSSASLPGWGQTVFRDVGCDGRLDPVDTVITTHVPVVADQRVCVLVKVAVPATASYNQRLPLDVLARLTLTTSAMVLDHTRADLTIVGQPTDTGLRLTKSVDRGTAKTGDTLVYTITYVNQGAGPITALKLYDVTPAYTVMASATCGTSPSPSLVCTVAAQPGAGATGSVRWTFTGDLPSGASGTVTFSVVVN